MFIITMSISVLLIALIVLLIIILLLFLYYTKQQPPKKVCTVHTDCGTGEHCVRGSCTSLCCLHAVQTDKRNITIHSIISSCEFTPNFYRFMDTAAVVQQEFGKTRHSIQISPSPSVSHTPQEVCARYCSWGTDVCTGWEYVGIAKEGTCYIYIIPHHPVLIYGTNHVIPLPRNHIHALINTIRLIISF
uniref:PKP177R n=1 Tax=African swine fever virus TaxID=10497 RepID=A0A6G7KTM3_ASF